MTDNTEATTINGILSKLTVQERLIIWNQIDRLTAEAFNDGLSSAAYKIRNQITKEFSL